MSADRGRLPGGPRSRATRPLRELVAVELELRLAAGEAPKPADYCERFPALTPAIPRLFEETRASPTPPIPSKGAAPSATPGSDASYNLLFGLLALQNNFI